MMNKQKNEKKAAPVMKRLAREVSAIEAKAIAGGISVCQASSGYDGDIVPAK